MTYYKVIKENAYSDITPVAGELYTKKELEKRGISAECSMFEPVDVKKNNTYICFGRRFECKYKEV